MSDILEGIAGNKMLQLKQDIAALKEALEACEDEEEKKAIRKELNNKRTYYNILADQQKINH